MITLCHIVDEFDEFEKLCNQYDIELLTPVFDLTDDYEKENELLRYRFLPVANEGKCLLGYPMDRKLTKEDIIEAKKWY